ncbi:ArsR/SmtB family transcription factor [Candidatus Nitrosarchaeum limnium]|jgi:DNA-binding transcriptional ArsR family regulator|uniref:Transcriptional regulator, ArsR family n=1 Tax=Candidatus Nitrosarchaeum limnium BG20 TaxID=859192 RepID=S2EJS5_9ARCH|nr:winged helix-turn-helix domain-containing protein [Candidatus Nitrosarchaeum limnium]EPA04952.1 transcriptional regulator, ArsR family [Candidatus Nitrosarchaeum limnium BG20]
MKDEIEDNSIGIADRVEILSTEDQKIKAIGEILSSDSSREILKILFNDSLTANQIAQKTDISLPLVIYHLKKMQEAGVVKITNIGKNTKERDMKFYTVDKLAIVILPLKMSEPAKKSKSLFNSFTRIHRLATLGGVSIAAWFSSQLIQKGREVSINENMIATNPISPDTPEMAMKSMPVQEAGDSMVQSTQIMQPIEPLSQLLWSVVAVLSVIVAGLVIEVVISRKYSKYLKTKIE